MVSKAKHRLRKNADADEDLHMESDFEEANEQQESSMPPRGVTNESLSTHERKSRQEHVHEGKCVFFESVVLDSLSAHVMVIMMMKMFFITLTAISNLCPALFFLPIPLHILHIRLLTYGI